MNDNYNDKIKQRLKDVKKYRIQAIIIEPTRPAAQKNKKVDNMKQLLLSTFILPRFY